MAHETPPINVAPGEAATNGPDPVEENRRALSDPLLKSSQGLARAASDLPPGISAGSAERERHARTIDHIGGNGFPELPDWWSALLALVLGSSVTAVCLLMAAWSSEVTVAAVKEAEAGGEAPIVFPDLVRPPPPSLSTLGQTPTVVAAWNTPSVPGPVVLPAAPSSATVATFGAAPGAGVSGLAGLSLTGGASLLLGQPRVSEPQVFEEDAVDQPPRSIGERARTYPAEALALQMEGFVRLRLRIDEDGRVQEVRVLEAVPSGVFDASAVEDARRWRFSPALHNGEAVEVWATTQVDYALE
ncbi:MAG: TonB family protein [Myxococcales bacterium]|nr:TonB family protein [Myxococcales bacterium]